jgi:hypothetical protein
VVFVKLDAVKAVAEAAMLATARMENFIFKGGWMDAAQRRREKWAAPKEEAEKIRKIARP